MLKQPAFHGLRDAMKKKQTRAGGVPVRDGRSSTPGAADGVNHTALSEDRIESRAFTLSVGNDAAHLLPPESVCPERSDGRGHAL